MQMVFEKQSHSAHVCLLSLHCFRNFFTLAYAFALVSLVGKYFGTMKFLSSNRPFC